MNRCGEHPAYDADYCPICGTTILIGERSLDYYNVPADRVSEVWSAFQEQRDFAPETDLAEFVEAYLGLG